MMKTNLAYALLAGLCLSFFAKTDALAQSRAYERGAELLADENFQEAIPHLENALSKDKGSPEYTYTLALLGKAYQKTFQFAKAEATFKELYAKQGKNTPPEALLGYAQVLASNENYKLSQRIYGEYGMKKPADSRPRSFIPAYMEVSGFDKNPTTQVQALPIIPKVAAAFSPTYYDGGLVFVGSERPTTTLDKGQGGGHLRLFLLPDRSVVEKILDVSELEPVPFPLNSKFHLGPLAFRGNQHILITKNAYERKKRRQGLHVNRLVLLESKLQNGKWSDPRELPFNSDTYSCGHPAVTPDGQVLIFASDMEGGFGGTDLYAVPYNNGLWGKPVNLGKEVNTEGNEMFPFIDEANRLYFSSDGHAGLGGLDLFAVPLENGKPTSDVQNLGKPFNSSKDDFGISTDSTRREGFLSSARNGSDHLFYFKQHPAAAQPVVAAAPKPAVEEAPATNPEPAPAEAAFGSYEIRGIVSSLASSDLLPNTRVTLLDVCNNKYYHATTSQDGKYSFRLDQTGPFLLKVEHNGYGESEEVVSKLNAPITHRDVGLMKQGDVISISNIYYEYGSDDLSDLAKKELRLKVVPLLRQFSTIRVEIGSHTDSRSSAEFNLELSQRRADKVVDFLIANGISDKQVVGKGYGETKLVNDCADGVKCSEMKHFENRRTEFKVLDIGRSLVTN